MPAVIRGCGSSQNHPVLLLCCYCLQVRTDGDSFTLAFHDAADAVAFCIKVSCSCSWSVREYGIIHSMDP
jgi:hypothetical protein